MCITKETSFRFGDKLFATELEAVKAALDSIGRQLLKDYSHNPIQGLVSLGGDITSLRDRYLELTAPEENA